MRVFSKSLSVTMACFAALAFLATAHPSSTVSKGTVMATVTVETPVNPWSFPLQFIPPENDPA
jgi:hypothetical protein